MEEDTYEKNVVLYCSIGEPRHIAGKEGRRKEEEERSQKKETKSGKLPLGAYEKKTYRMFQ